MIVVLADLQPYIFDGRAPAAANQGSLMETGRARKALSTYLQTRRSFQMANSRPVPLLSHLPTFDSKTGDLTVVIETPKGSRNKYDYDSSCGAFRFASLLPEGMSFPFDFGFVPSSLGGDGDPLDVLVIMDASTPVGCVVSARLIGVIEAPAMRNRRLVGAKRSAARGRHSQSTPHARQISGRLAC